MYSRRVEELASFVDGYDSPLSDFNRIPDSPLVLLPPEILRLIFAELKSSTTRFRVFKPICKALLPFQRRNALESIRITSTNNLYRFASAISSNITLGKYVEKFYFDGVEAEELETLFENRITENQVKTMFNSFKNVKSISIYSPILVKFFLSIGVQLPQLYELNLSNPIEFINAGYYWATRFEIWDFDSFIKAISSYNITHLGIVVSKEVIVPTRNQIIPRSTSSSIQDFDSDADLQAQEMWEEEYGEFDLNGTELDHVKGEDEVLEENNEYALDFQEEEEVEYFDNDNDNDSFSISTINKYRSISSNIANMRFDEAGIKLNYIGEEEAVVEEEEEEEEEETAEDDDSSNENEEKFEENEFEEAEEGNFITEPETIEAGEFLELELERKEILLSSKYPEEIEVLKKIKVEVEEELVEIEKSDYSHEEFEISSSSGAVVDGVSKVKIDSKEVIESIGSNIILAVTHLDYEGPLDSPGILDFILSFTNLQSLSIQNTSTHTRLDDQDASYYANFASSIQELHIYDSFTLIEIPFDSNFFDNITTLTIDFKGFWEFLFVHSVLTHPSCSVITLNLGEHVWSMIQDIEDSLSFILPGPEKLSTLKNVNLLLDLRYNPYRQHQSIRFRGRRSLGEILMDRRCNFKDFILMAYHHSPFNQIAMRFEKVESFIQAGLLGKVVIDGDAVRAFKLLKEKNLL